MSDLLPHSSTLRRMPSGFTASLETPALSAMCPAVHGDSPSAPLPRLDPQRASATVVDYATSQRLAAAVNAQDSRCYENALCALPRLDDAAYVEGVAVTGAGLQFDHAWLEHAGCVVDPTPSYAAMTDGACTYFVGPRWTLPEVLALFTSDDEDLPTPLLQPGTSLSPRREAWIRAKLAAFRHVSALRHARTGRPAIAAEDEEAMLEGLLGCYWAKWVRSSQSLGGGPGAEHIGESTSYFDA